MIQVELTFGEKLKDRRTELKLTQRELASKADISASSISAYENDAKDCSTENLQRLAKALDVSINYLLGVDNCKEANNEEIHRRLGLTEMAIGTLESMNENWEEGIDIINHLLISTTFAEFVNNLSHYRERSAAIGFREACDAQAKLRLYYTKILDEYGRCTSEELEKIGIDLEYIKAELDKNGGPMREKKGIQIKRPEKHYKKPEIGVSPDEARDVALFKVSRTAEKLAAEFVGEDSGERPAQKNP